MLNGGYGNQELSDRGRSGTGKTSVATELERRGYHVVHGDRVLAYVGDPETGQALAAPPKGADRIVWGYAHWIWPVDKVRAIVSTPPILSPSSVAARAISKNSVVETGSFAAASRKLNRATSVISYTIANLEAQLGVTLFDRLSTKKPQLTLEGRTVLAEAKSVAHGIDNLRAKVKSMLRGVEPEVHLALESCFLPPVSWTR